MTEIRLYKSRWRALKLILVCSIFVALGLWGIVTGNMPGWAAWLNSGFFGIGLLVGFYHLFDKRPQIIINENGIFDRTTHKDFINWEIIQNAYLVDIQSQKFICLVVDEIFKPSYKKSKLYQHAARVSEAMGAQELNISLGQIKIDGNKLTEFILLLRTASRQNKRELITKMLT